MNTQAADFADLPAHPLLRIELTADGRVLVNGQPIEVPHGDVRAAAVNAAEDYAASRGHPVRVTVRLPHSAPVNLIASPGQRVVPQPQAPPAPAVAASFGGPPAATMRITLPAPIAAQPTADGHANVRAESAAPAPPAAHRDERVRALYALLKDHPQPPEGVRPGEVPAWPTLAITLHAEGRAQVEGREVPQVDGFSAREAAVAAAALHLRALGLDRPARAVATDPDGTVWPLIIHPNGSAEGAGEPAAVPRRRLRRRER
jgi:hypothetical protein